MERNEKKPDLRDKIYPPLSVTEIERKDPLGETPPQEVYEPEIVAPDSRVPEGQTTHG